MDTAFRINFHIKLELRFACGLFCDVFWTSAFFRRPKNAEKENAVDRTSMKILIQMVSVHDLCFREMWFSFEFVEFGQSEKFEKIA